MRRAVLRVLFLCVAAFGLTSCMSMRAGSSTPRPFKFAQVCDTQLGAGGYEHDIRSFKQAVKQINALELDFVLICGDLVEKANDTSFADFKNIKAGFNIPCYCVPGNHDVGNVATVKSIEYYRKIIGEDYYSFEHKGLVFVCVNTQLWKSPVDGESGKHDAWFEDVLKAASKKGKPVFVVGHYPLYALTVHEPETPGNLPIEKRKQVLALCESHGVVAVLTGHAHRIIINDHNGIQLVTGQATSKTHGSPLGFRVWDVTLPASSTQYAVPLEGF